MFNRINQKDINTNNAQLNTDTNIPKGESNGKESTTLNVSPNVRNVKIKNDLKYYNPNKEDFSNYEENINSMAIEEDKSPIHKNTLEISFITPNKKIYNNRTFHKAADNVFESPYMKNEPFIHQSPFTTSFNPRSNYDQNYRISSDNNLFNSAYGSKVFNSIENSTAVNSVIRRLNFMEGERNLIEDIATCSNFSNVMNHGSMNGNVTRNYKFQKNEKLVKCLFNLREDTQQSVKTRKNSLSENSILHFYDLNSRTNNNFDHDININISSSRNTIVIQRLNSLDHSHVYNPGYTININNQLNERISAKRDKKLEAKKLDETAASASKKPDRDSNQADFLESQRSTEVQKARCTCKKSKCLKLYCDCFSNGNYCVDCNCVGCHNTVEYEEERQAIQSKMLEKNSNAFKPKITNEGQKHSRGCNCSKSNCLKGYCECFQSGIECCETCRCKDCKNTSEYRVLKKNKELFIRNKLRSEPKPEINPSTVITQKSQSEECRPNIDIKYCTNSNTYFIRDLESSNRDNPKNHQEKFYRNLSIENTSIYLGTKDEGFKIERNTGSSAINTPSTPVSNQLLKTKRKSEESTSGSLHHKANNNQSIPPTASTRLNTTNAKTIRNHNERVRKSLIKKLNLANNDSNEVSD